MDVLIKLTSVVATVVLFGYFLGTQENVNPTFASQLLIISCLILIMLGIFY